MAAKRVSFNESGNPAKTGLYHVAYDEGYGKAYRYYNAEDGVWGRMEHTEDDAIRNKAKKTSLGFLPWVAYDGSTVEAVPTVTGTVDVDGTVTDTTVAKVSKSRKPATPKAATAAPKAAKTVAPKAPKAPKVAGTKTVHPDGTIVFREDRQKYMAYFGGKAEAARPTIEAAKGFLTKKYGVTEFNVI